MISWKMFWTTLGGVIAGCAGAALSLFGATLLLVLPTLAGSTIAFAIAARVIVQGFSPLGILPVPMFRDTPTGSRQMISRLIAASATANATLVLLWTVTFPTSPQLSVLWVVLIAALALVEYAFARSHEYVRTNLKTSTGNAVATRPTSAANPYTDPSAAGNAEMDNVVATLKAALVRIGKHRQLILSATWEGISDSDGSPFGVRYYARVPAKQIGASATGLSASDAESIASGLSEIMQEHGEPDAQIMTEWVSITKQRGPGAYSIVVVNQDVMGRIFAHDDDPRPTSISELCVVGYTLEAKPYAMPLNQHGSDVGMSTSGKSSLAHVKLAHTTRCTDEVDWIAGVEKLYDLIGPWVEPYRGTDYDIPFDWIAAGPIDSAEMLSAAMSVARWRQNQPLSERQHFQTIIVWLDEATFTLRHVEAYAMREGVWLSASQHTEEGTRGAASAMVFFRLISQRSTINNWGSCGGDIAANLIDNAVFMSNDSAEVGRATGDHKLPMPTNRGEYWLNPGTGDLPVKLKAPYIQTDDPSKKKLLPEGPYLSEVSWSRRNIEKGLDAGSGRAAGRAYANRKRTADDVIAYVLGAANVSAPQETTQQQPTTVDAPTPPDAQADQQEQDPRKLSLREQMKRQVEAEIAEMDSANGYVPDEPAPAATIEHEQRPQIEPAQNNSLFTQVAQSLPPKSRKERVYQLVVTAEQPLTRAEIVDRLQSTYGDETDPQQVTNLLGALTSKEQRLERTSDNRYTQPAGVGAQA